MTETRSSSAGNSEENLKISGDSRGSGIIIAVVLILAIVVIGSLVLSTVGIPGGESATPLNETDQNSTDNGQRDSRQENTSRESFDPAALNTSNQAPVERWDEVVFTNKTDTGIAASQTARMRGLDNHAELMAEEFTNVGLNASGAEGQLYSTNYNGIEAPTAYANFSSVRVTIEEDQQVAENAADLTARTLPDVVTNGSPPETYSNTSGEALQPDYVSVIYQLEDGTIIGGMVVPTKIIRAYEHGEISREQYANATIGTLSPPDPRRWKTGNTTVEPPTKPPKEILTPEGLFGFENGLQQERINYTEYNPPEYNVVPQYYESNPGIGFEVEVYVDENESLAATLPLSARTIGHVGLYQYSGMRGGSGFNFVDATYYTHDGEKLGEVRYDPRPNALYAVANITAEEYAASEDTFSSFNATHPDAQSIKEQNMTRLAREGQLRLWADAYEDILTRKYGHELTINSTTVDVDDEELHVHTSVTEWPEDTASSSPAAMRTHTTDAMQYLYAYHGLTLYEPKQGVYVYQENKVRFNGNSLDRSSMILYAETDAAREATSEGRDTNEALQWAANVTFDAAYFYRGHDPEPDGVFNRTLEEWKKSDLTFVAGEERNPPDDE